MLKDCTKSMSADDFTQFNMFFLKVNDVCLALNNEMARIKVLKNKIKREKIAFFEKFKNPKKEIKRERKKKFKKFQKISKNFKKFKKKKKIQKK